MKNNNLGKQTRFERPIKSGKNNSIYLAFITDDGYVMPTCVAVTSLIDNIDVNYKYFIYILTVGIREENTKRLTELNGYSENVVVELKRADSEFLDVKNLHLGDKEKYLSATSASLLKFKLVQIFSDLDKLLFLDGDIIITDNLVSLYFTDLGDSCLGAVRDLPQVLYNEQIIGKEISGRDYFNSGVMLLNLEKIRNENYTQQLIDTKKKLTNSVLMDQDIFNIVFKKKILALPPKYNVCYLNYVRSAAKYSLDDLNRLYGTEYSEISDLANNASVIHFSSKTKPWLCFDVSFADEWIRYYFNSPFKNVPLGRTFHLTEKIDKKELQAEADELSNTEIDTQNTIPIVFCADQAYIRIASATLASIADHADDSKFYDVYILHDAGLWTSYTYMFKDVVKNKPNFRVNFLDVRNMVKTDIFYSRAHYSKQMYYRWFIPEVLSRYEKVLYLDCDIIVLRDVAELFNTDLNGHVIGAVNNFVSRNVREYLENTIGVLPSEYINSGVLLIDCRKFIESRIKKKCLELLTEKDKLMCPDQDVINIACKGDICYLEDNWNYQWHHEYPKEKRQKLISEYQKRFKAAREEPYIIHYTAGVKPWKQPEWRYSHYFWGYLRQTMYYEEVIYKYWDFRLSKITGNNGELTTEAEQYKEQLMQVTHSLTFITGELVLYIPKKIRNLFRKLKNHNGRKN